MKEDKKKENIINIKTIKENIKILSNIDKSLIPYYLDNLKKKYNIKEEEIKKDNPYYKYF